jgi:hypothetical protein
MRFAPFVGLSRKGVRLVEDKATMHFALFVGLSCKVIRLC